MIQQCFGRAHPGLGQLILCYGEEMEQPASLTTAKMLPKTQAEMVRRLGAKPVVELWSKKFQKAWESLPAQDRQGFACALSKKVCQWPLESGYDANQFQSYTDVLIAYKEMAKCGVEFEKTAWPVWWAQQMIVQDNDWRNQASVFTAAFRMDPHASPLGVYWDEDVALAWGRAFGKFLLQDPEAVKKGIHPIHEGAVAKIVEFHKYFSHWGLQTPQTMDAFEAGLSLGCPHWEQAVEDATLSLLDSEWFLSTRAEWKQRRLDQSLTTAPVSLPKRSRL